jgi:photosystem II biogenesis protein Psp29
VNNIRTVSDTKKAFYTIHTRPINSIYRRVVEELMVEMHLLSVNADFRYDPIYALGVVTAFDRFMQGYRPERDRDSIFNALCRALEGDPQTYRNDADMMKASVSNLSLDELLSGVRQLETADSSGTFGHFKAIAERSDFKYSRLFAIGLYTVLETIDPEVVSSEEKRNHTLEALCETLHLPSDKVNKDLELYRSNLEKITQAQAVLDDVLKADRKKREQREQENNAAKEPITAPPDESSETSA